MTHPLALIIYNRPNHLRQVIDALRPQKPEPVYVFCDGPKDKGDEILVWEARSQIRHIDWAVPYVLLREENIGLAASIVAAADDILRMHPTVIVLEDDCVPGPRFIAFMEDCLDRYAEDAKTLCVTGYTVEIPNSLQAVHPWDVYWMPRTETWGWATWRHKWKLYERNRADALNRAKTMQVPLDRGGPDIPGILEGKDSWCPGWMLACYLNDMYCAFPTVSHIQNTGMNGTGVHCGKSERWVTPIAQDKPTRFPEAMIEDKNIEHYVREYHARY